MDKLAGEIPSRLVMEWALYYELVNEDREERQLIAKAEAEADQKMSSMKTDPHFRRKMNG